ncbi:MAG: thioredoxin family protein [Bacteroidales bacterium]|nr:thioredoxin family protein [Bacteroidales bacterium]
MKHLNQLTRHQFLNRIYNYKQYPGEFIYIGTSPCVVVVGSSGSIFCRELEPALEIMAKRNKDHYGVYYIDVSADEELAKALKTDKFPVVYLCPVKSTPTIFKGTINIREISEMAGRVLTALRKM